MTSCPAAVKNNTHINSNHVSTTTIPKLSHDIIVHSILPFINDRKTWNVFVCCDKDLYKIMVVGQQQQQQIDHYAKPLSQPPWPRYCRSTQKQESAFQNNSLSKLPSFQCIPNEAIMYVTISRDGLYIACANNQGFIYIWNCWKGMDPLPVSFISSLSSSSSCVKKMEFCPTNSNLLCISNRNGKYIKVIDISTKTIIATLTQGQGNLFFSFELFSWSPNGQYIATIGATQNVNDLALQLWVIGHPTTTTTTNTTIGTQQQQSNTKNYNQCYCVQKVSISPRLYNCLEYSPCGTIVVFGNASTTDTWNRQIQQQQQQEVEPIGWFWNLETNQIEYFHNDDYNHTNTAINTGISTIAFSQSGQSFVTGNLISCEIQLWSVSTKTCIRRLQESDNDNEDNNNNDNNNNPSATTTTTTTLQQSKETSLPFIPCFYRTSESIILTAVTVNHCTGEIFIWPSIGIGKTNKVLLMRLENTKTKSINVVHYDPYTSLFIFGTLDGNFWTHKFYYCNV